MKIINIKSILSLIVIVSLITACEKDTTMKDEESPVITIQSPSLNNMFMNGDTVNIHADITDNDELHEISAQLTHTHMGTSEVVWSLETHSHQETFSLYDEYIIDVLGMHHDFKLELSASDHNGNVGTKEFHFHVMQ